MNLRNWSKQHTIGLIIGLLTVILVIPIVIYFLSLSQGFSFKYLFREFFSSPTHITKDVSLACIANLFWFHRFLKKEKYNLAYGVIAATIIFLLIIIYFKFLA